MVKMNYFQQRERIRQDKRFFCGKEVIEMVRDEGEKKRI